MAYKSRYETQLSSALDQITNREKFKYDFNADPLYHMYKDQYVKLGNDAAANAAATVAGLTGGYGSSYATTAAAQANQDYLTKLNEVVPQLYNQALNAYMAEGDRLTNLYGTLSDAEAADYTKYRDTVADEQWQKNFDENVRQWQANYDENLRQWQANYDYQKARDAVADKQWQTNYDYQAARDAVADEQWQKNYDYNVGRDKVSDEQWQKNYDYQVGRDAETDRQWQANYDENKRQWQANYDEAIRQYNQNYAYQQQRDAVADSQWAQSFAAQQAAHQAALAARTATTTTTTTSKPKATSPTWRNNYNTLNQIKENDWKNLTNIYKNSGKSETALTSTITSLMGIYFNIDDAVNAYVSNGYTQAEAQNLAKEDYDNVWQQIKNRVFSLAR